ncbi:MAG: methyltransferase domain-containing protein, partial [Nannocystaceae bacterium]
MARHRISVRGLPAWVPTERLLDAGVWTSREDGGESVLSAERGASDAADIQARLRGMVLAGVPLSIEVEPGLPRSRVREARLTDARRRRETTPGFDRPGCRMDEEGRWSLTPAVIAREIGARAGGRPVLDLGCGVGGNSIGFARAGCDVLAVERDADRIEHARHNAKVYQVADRIQFTLGDAYAWSARAEG